MLRQATSITEHRINRSGNGSIYSDHCDVVDGIHLVDGIIKEGKKSQHHPFPVTLHYVLDTVEADGLSHIMSWQPHGRCFLVHKRDEFVKTFLPNWFRQSNYASFQRQLNLYSFKRITAGPDKGGYYHEFFLRTKPFLACNICRTIIKNKGPRKPACPEMEPNFYRMRPLPFSNQGTVKYYSPILYSQDGQNSYALPICKNSFKPLSFGLIAPSLLAANEDKKQDDTITSALASLNLEYHPSQGTLSATRFGGSNNVNQSSHLLTDKDRGVLDKYYG